MSESPHIPLYLRPAVVDPKKPFFGDRFERQALARQLTGYVLRLPEGGVIAIDARWGDGKTWFGCNWHALLRVEGFRTGYIDCFKRDYLEDPFVMIAAEMIGALKPDQASAKDSLISAGKRLGAVLAPAASKAVINAAGHWLLGKQDLAEELGKGLESLKDSAATVVEAQLEQRFKDYEREKSTVEAFSKALIDAAALENKPIVIFLDELDRCRPDFALRTIERMKHFFDVPNVVFVLLLNRRQLEAGVKGAYGADVDAAEYLGKFITLTLTLPKAVSFNRKSADSGRLHFKAVLKRLGYQVDESTAHCMGVLAVYFDMSFRDLESAATLYALSPPNEKLQPYVPWPIALKLKRETLFRNLLVASHGAHSEASDLLIPIAERVGQLRWLTELISAVHNAGHANFVARPNQATQERIQELGFLDALEFFDALFRPFDLSVSMG